MCNISLPVLSNLLESVRLTIGCPVVRTDGRAAGGRAVYGHMITKLSGMGRFTTHGASQAREARQSSAINIKATHNCSRLLKISRLLFGACLHGGGGPQGR